MRAALTAAARNAADSGDADAAELRKLVKKQDQQKLALTIQTAKTVSHILEEPQLPAKRDLALWWPEPERRETLNPLRPFPSLSPGSQPGAPRRRRRQQ